MHINTFTHPTFGTFQILTESPIDGWMMLQLAAHCVRQFGAAPGMERTFEIRNLAAISIDRSSAPIVRPVIE
jgi:hypothetical protein